MWTSDGRFLKGPLEWLLSFYSPGRWHDWPQAFLQATVLKAEVPLTTEATREGRAVERAPGEDQEEKVQPRRSQIASGGCHRHRREGALPSFPNPSCQQEYWKVPKGYVFGVDSIKRNVMCGEFFGGICDPPPWQSVLFLLYKLK